MIVDLHVHGHHAVPWPVRAAWKVVAPRHPQDVDLVELERQGVDVVVAKAIGDGPVRRWHGGVETQLDELAAYGGVMDVVLGVEGGDDLARDPGLVEPWADRGVRMVTLVHLGDNGLGTTCMPWQQYTGFLPVRRKQQPGLTDVGQHVLVEMERLGVLADVSHADSETLRGVVGAATKPVIASHSGARALQPDFPRYLTDEEIRMIAGTGGVVGLWPYWARGRGTDDMTTLVAHARHIADLVGPQHVAVGTDTNGVPGVADGYRDVRSIGDALREDGFSPDEIAGILGDNAARLLGFS